MIGETGPKNGMYFPIRVMIQSPPNWTLRKELILEAGRLSCDLEMRDTGLPATYYPQSGCKNISNLNHFISHFFYLVFISIRESHDELAKVSARTLSFEGGSVFSAGSGKLSVGKRESDLVIVELLMSTKGKLKS